MFWRDHNPPHFHVRYSNFRAIVGIADLRIIRGDLPRIAKRLVMEWASDHQAELMENWRLCQTKERPVTIAPLP